MERRVSIEKEGEISREKVDKRQKTEYDTIAISYDTSPLSLKY